MPELPDIVVYLDCLAPRVIGQPLEQIRIIGPSLLRSVDPAISEAEGQRVTGVRRLGKRIVIELENDVFLVLHLMIAGRLRWKNSGAKPGRKLGLAAFDFPGGSLILTEASTRKRASLHLVRGEAALSDHDRGGLEVLESDEATFAARLVSENHT
ncbi:unnamed protein product, partial [marine sediment metagenome]